MSVKTGRSEKEMTALDYIETDLAGVIKKHGLSVNPIGEIWFNELIVKMTETMDEQGYHID